MSARHGDGHAAAAVGAADDQIADGRLKARGWRIAFDRGHGTAIRRDRDRQEAMHEMIRLGGEGRRGETGKCEPGCNRSHAARAPRGKRRSAWMPVQLSSPDGWAVWCIRISLNHPRGVEKHLCASPDTRLPAS